MCLSSIISKDKKYLKKFKYGWKLFYFNNFNKVLGLHKHYVFNNTKWNIDKNNDVIESFEDGGYKTGFHCYEKRSSARIKQNVWGGSIRKVLIKDVVAYGIEPCGNVIVCKQLKITSTRG